MPQQKLHLDYNNVRRALGLKKRPGSKAKVAAFDVPVIPQSEWKPKSYKTGVPIYDQGQRGSCVGNGSATMIMKCREASNIDSSLKILSPIFLYDQINGGVDQGSDPSDAMNVLQSMGICLHSTVGQDAPLNKNRLPQIAYEEAKRFIIPPNAIYSLKNFEQLVTAFLLGFKAGITINVGNIFAPDNNGIITYTSGPGNHWVAIGDTLKQITSAAHSPIWALEFTNSWSQNWGNGGKAFITQQHLNQKAQNGQDFLEMYAIKYVSDDPAAEPQKDDIEKLEEELEHELES